MPVDVSDVDGYTALHRATWYNRTDVIKRLVHEGAHVNRQDDEWENYSLRRTSSI